MSTLDEYARAGMTAVAEQRIADAILSFEKALALDPSRPDLNNALGTAHLHRGEVVPAIPYLERSVTLAEPYDAPEHQELKRHFHLTLATAYQMADRIGDARRALEQMVARWPKEAEPRLQLGQLLLTSCQLQDGLAVYRALADFPALDREGRDAAEAVVGVVRAFLDSEQPASLFLEAHAGSYRSYFDEIAAKQQAEGWYAEASKMGRKAGELVPYLADGARPYALTRVDLVNPHDGAMANVYTEQEPMIVAVEGLEPLAQLPIMLPWTGWPFETFVCTQCPWHWLQITIQFATPGAAEELVERIDPLVGDWYLRGYNGDFGTKDEGRFHYVTDPDIAGDRAVSYVVDLGRARYDAVEALMRGLVALHDRHPIQRVLFGRGHLPD